MNHLKDVIIVALNDMMNVISCYSPKCHFSCVLKCTF